MLWLLQQPAIFNYSAPDFATEEVSPVRATQRTMIAWEVQAYDSAVLGPYSSSYIIHLFLQGKRVRLKGPSCVSHARETHHLMGVPGRCLGAPRPPTSDSQADAHSFLLGCQLTGRIGLETKLRMKGHLGFRSLASYFVHIEEDNLAAQAGARAALLPREESAAQQQGGSSAQSGAPAQTSP